MPGASVCPVALSCRELPFSESPIVARLAADRCSRAALDGAVPDSHPDGSRIPRWSPYLRRLPLDWRERAPTQASGSCVNTPCPPESGPSASDLRGPDDRIVSSKRDVRVFHKGNFPSSRFLLIYRDVSCLDPFTNVLPRITLDPPLLVTRVVSRASGTITFSDSCLGITSHFASAYRVAYPVAGRDTDRSPGVTHESSVSCRQQTPWYDG